MTAAMLAACGAGLGLLALVGTIVQWTRRLEIQERVDNALDVITDCGQTDGEHHKAWVIDQVARELLGPDYDEWVKDYKTGALIGMDDAETYAYDVGIAP